MPTYEYRCDSCGKDFETVKRMSDPVDTTCPHCGAPTDHRLISHSSFVLKGSGWYATDYGKKNGRSSPGTTPASTSSGSDSSTESSCGTCSTSNCSTCS